MKPTLAIVFLAACGGGGGGNPDGAKTTDGTNPVVDTNSTQDAFAFKDASPVVPAMIKVSGTATSQGLNSSPVLAGVAIGFFKVSDETTALATATSAADGTYSFEIPSAGTVVDGFIKGTISGSLDNYVYPPEPLAADFPADISMVSTSYQTLLDQFTGQTATAGLVIVSVIDSTGANVPGAAVASVPASTYEYDNGSIPSKTAKATASDGVGFFVNAPPGDMSITATLAGKQFKARTLKSRVGALTNSTIVER